MPMMVRVRSNADNVNTGNTVNNDENENVDSFMVLDFENKKADYANVKATDLPTVQRLFPPNQQQ